MHRNFGLSHYKHILGHPNHSRGHFAEKNGTRTDIARNNLESPIRWNYLCEPDWKFWFTIFGNFRHCLAFLSLQHIAISVVYAEMHIQPWAISGWKHLVGLRIATYLCRWNEDLARIVIMPSNVLFGAMNNFFRQVVNFSEQRVVRKVALAYFATMAESLLLCRNGCAIIPLHKYLPAQEWAGLRFYSYWSNTYRITPIPKESLNTIEINSMWSKSACLASQPA